MLLSKVFAHFYKLAQMGYLDPCTLSHDRNCNQRNICICLLLVKLTPVYARFFLSMPSTVPSLSVGDIFITYTIMFIVKYIDFF
jgi:hypothetical protein